ncbi:unannotated protein [freshwater metagenome]|uniref:Unannotated protein n=1 Tax=freshwater metagenome TaxID=449393 RepID=A0A6J6D8P3_9ZZZZ|nr:substrate-binding domain-containing protein [Actinomycetota bacterium]
MAGWGRSAPPGHVRDTETMSTERTTRPRMIDVAAAADVSVQSVSNFANGRWARLSVATRGRIEEAIAQLNYQVNNSARGLRSARTQTLGFLVLDDSHRFVADPLTALYLAGIADTARERGYSVLVHTTAHTKDHAELLRPISEGRVDAACVLLTGSPAVRRRVAQMLNQTDTEFVLFDELAVAKVAGRAFVVRSDQAAGATAIVDHLVAQGHRRIAFIAAKERWAVIEQRFDAYKRALRRHGIDIDPELTLFEAGWEPTGADAMVRKLLALNTPPSAIVCGSDLLAIGAMRTLREVGIAVPDQMAVCGFDDFDVSKFVNPQLTTVTVPAWEMGASAAGLLIDTLEGTRSSITEVCLSTKLQVRESA